MPLGPRLGEDIGRERDRRENSEKYVRGIGTLRITSRPSGPERNTEPLVVELRRNGPSRFFGRAVGRP
jgi:hypothetical protein